ncbi:H(+)-transporting V1 sector ATPase subunit E [Saccharomycopsis crataegensis]|uniref:H(+)-transporting V1 sector ATPase subunit E n=1 Tax=Saccharomycopsis crataegensis TaxID=43959 RepID=A0AAV5QTA6_9ASCO|nr:H(+)-transporting V1 sector ATPase subunit E [Saccharomycopsis crataegensis]
MPSSHALSDDQVSHELFKMEAFIKKEAEEKAKEIRLKADEEYEIEKSNIVRSEISSIDKLFEQKLKKSELAQQITKSTIVNKTRLKILAERESILNEIYASTETQLKASVKDAKAYKEVMIKLVEEGLYTLLEPKVSLKIRKGDTELVKEILPTVTEVFEKTAKFPVEILIKEDEYLDDALIGGVIIVNGTGKIEVNNTLEERLHLLSETALPSIRLELFGPSHTRKFFE